MLNRYWWLTLTPMAVAPLSTLAQETIEGLVEVPALYERLNAGLPDSAVGSVPLFAAPGDDSEASILVRSWQALESREHGYEQLSAVVYAREVDSAGGFWYQVRFVGEGGPLLVWLNQADAGTYRMVQQLVRSGLSYLTDDWNGLLYAAPGLDSSAQSYRDEGARPDARILDTYQRSGEPMWYLVAIVKGSCDSGPIEVVATGWVPAHSDSGGSTVWFYSRGC